MSLNLDRRYYNLALCHARRHDLSGAAAHARRALMFNEGNEKARRLLDLCLYELGELSGSALAEQGPVNETFERVRELVKRKKWRKAEALLRGIEHQSVRILNTRGCLNAAAKRYAAAASLFAQALEKDRGNCAASAYLMEVVKRQRSWRWIL